jgi:tRNA (Thr-GGU) A37 N-methylase
MDIVYRPIGVIRSPFHDIEDMYNKPYVPAFDAPPRARTGWFEGAKDRIGSVRSDGRFR